MKTPTTTAFQFALGVYAGASTELRKIEAQRAAAIAKASAKYASDIEDLQQKIDGAKDTVTRYANAPGNRESLLPAGQKTFSIQNVEIGWRNLPASLRLLEDNTWEGVKELVEKKLPKEGLRTTVELDKNALKAFAQESATNAKKLAACGMELAAGETFFIKIK